MDSDGLLIVVWLVVGYYWLSIDFIDDKLSVLKVVKWWFSYIVMVEVVVL